MTKRFTKERREHIHDLILERKRVTVKQLSEELDVSEVTLRTDLKEMEKEGLLTRTHGGAIMKEPTTPTGSFKKRSETNLKEKQIMLSAPSHSLKIRAVFYLMPVQRR
ncbi:DeoR family transcriptional regulator [Halolactibacillus sp. JCM 19043]|uniref:DeoR family transcriptional regulator n=1 Tax=Halolactibacillus sp. JCM 19043 TaxID=1460638 RepID=UPI000AE261CB|nr:DeoR family transcriptional regulator [Halolactibacillus sp. JCM 19043]